MSDTPRPLLAFENALVSSGPAPEYADKLMLYGQFVGDWRTRTTAWRDDGSVEETEWEVRFRWVLEGRAIQDLWITPPRREGVGWHTPGNRYSTTLRVYDPAIDAWHILWVNPPSGSMVRQLARQVGDEIIQVGEPDAKGRLTRWVYRDITAHSFRWCNELSRDQGAHWELVQQMVARRVGAA